MNEEIVLAWLFQKNNFFKAEMLIKAMQYKINFERLDWLELKNKFIFLKEISVSELDKIKFQIEDYQKLGIIFCYPGNIYYPSSFYNIDQPPMLFSFRGSPAWIKYSFLSVVGSRQPSSLSIQWMEQNLSEVLKLKQIGFASGGARGVDQKAHLLSIFNQRPTLVFTPSGINQIYPFSLNLILEKVLEQGGAIISEYLPHEVMQKRFFIQRNRLIAGISKATLLIEAGRKSGTMITARYSLEQGKPVWIMPSHPLDTKSLGGLDLLFDGASLVRDAEDLNLYIESDFNQLKQSLRI